MQIPFAKLLNFDIRRAINLLLKSDIAVKDRSIERYRRIAITGFSSVSSKFILSIIALVSVALTINHLGKQQFGLWMVVSSVIVWLQIADFGISNGIVNSLSEAYGNDDYESALSYISTAIVCNIVVSLLITPFFILLAFKIPWNFILNIDDTEITQLAAQCFFVAGIVFIIDLPLSAINRIYTALQQGYISNITQTLGSFISLLGLLLAIKFNMSLPYLVLSISLAPVLSDLLSWLLVPKVFKWYSFKVGSISMRAFKRILQTSIPLFFLQIGSLAINQLVNVLLANIGSLTLVADYNVLLRIYMLFFMVGSCFSLPFFPAIREAFERKEKEWVQHAIGRVLFFRIVTVMTLSIIPFFLGNWLILLWINKPLDHPFGLSGWMLFMGCMILSSCSSTIGDILIHLDVIKSQLKIVFIAAVMVLTGIYALVPSHGLSGVFLSMLVSTLFPIWWLTKNLRLKINELTEPS